MFALTADQDASRRTGDKVPQLLELLTSLPEAAGTSLDFERTVGDEVQGVFPGTAEGVESLLAIALRLQREQEWAVGIGIGAGRLAQSARASEGPAFIAARAAVERAKGRTVAAPIALESSPAHDLTAQTEALLQLLASVLRRRSEAGWEVIDLMPGRTQSQVAAELGVTPQAVGQRLDVALWAQEQGVRPLALRLLHEIEHEVSRA